MKKLSQCLFFIRDQKQNGCPIVSRHKEMRIQMDNTWGTIGQPAIYNI